MRDTSETADDGRRRPLPENGAHREIHQAVAARRPQLVVLLSEDGSGAARTLREAEPALRARRRRVVPVDLDDCHSLYDVAEAFHRSIASCAAWWICPLTMILLEELVVYQPLMAHEPPEVLIAPTSATSEPSNPVRRARRVLRRAIRWGKARWVIGDLRLPGKSETGDRSERQDRIASLIPRALAADLHAWTHGLLGPRQVVLAVVDHRRQSDTLAAARWGNFLSALADELDRLHSEEDREVRITILAARRVAVTPSNRQLPNGRYDEDGRFESPLIRHVEIAPPDPTTAERQRLGPNDHSERRLLRLAAALWEFDFETLEAAAGAALPAEWPEREVAHGTLERASRSTASPRWSVEPRLRAQLVDELAENDPRLFRATHSAARKHVANLPSPADDSDEAFIRKTLVAFHDAAANPPVGIARLVELADGELGRGRLDHAQFLLDAIDQLRPAEDDDRVHVVLLRAKLFSDMRGYGRARNILTEAAAEFPLDDALRPAAVALALHTAKLDRLRGGYEAAAARYERLERMAAGAAPIVAGHCAWQLAIVKTRCHDVPAARDQVAITHAALAARESWGDDRLRTEARRFGIANPHLKTTHLERLEADLDRMSGKYADAHRRLDQAIVSYERHGDGRSRAYALVTRSHVLRLEGLLAEAARQAEAVQRLYEQGIVLDERLRLHALRALVLARAAGGQECGEEAHALVRAPRELLPTAAPAGELALAEGARRRRDWRRAVRRYENAIETATACGSQADRCGATLGLLECHRAGAVADGASLRPVDELLDDLLEAPCTAAVPWLGLRAQLLRSYWHEDQRDLALNEAAELLATGFERRPEDAQVEADLHDRFVRGLAGGDIDPMTLEHI